MSDTKDDFTPLRPPREETWKSINEAFDRIKEHARESGQPVLILPKKRVTGPITRFAVDKKWIHDQMGISFDDTVEDLGGKKFAQEYPVDEGWLETLKSRGEEE